jgi:pimeloyl-ACP methyl ester carboxylesterase
MEKKLRLKTSDGHVIYGTLNSAAKTHDLAIFVHGLTGFQNEHIFYNAARFFPKKGIATFRFDLYSGEKGGRTLTDCTIKTHAADLEQVVKHFSPKYKKIHLVGHSLGGPTIVLANLQKITSITLWDPSDLVGLAGMVRNIERGWKKSRVPGEYVISWGTEYLLGKAMAEEYKTLRPVTQIAKVDVPVKVIAAAQGSESGGRAYFKHAKAPKEFVVIKNCGHTFDEEGKEEELFKETFDWIKKWSNK